MTKARSTIAIIEIIVNKIKTDTRTKSDGRSGPRRITRSRKKVSKRTIK